MPNKTIYIKKEHLSLFDEAQALGGESVSAVIIEALSDYVSAQKARDEHREQEVIVAQLVEELVRRAVAQNASDIHLQPSNGGNRVRFRIDGLLRDVEPLPPAQYTRVVERLQRAQAAVDEGVDRPPASGIVSLEVDERPVDLRVSVVRSVAGPSLTARVLLRDVSLPALSVLEPDGENTEALRHVFDRSHGLVVLTGPTGSGKTTTAYALLRTLDRDRLKVMTIEDPIEAIIGGCVQVPLDRRKGGSLAPEIDKIMLSDPDAVYISELRDSASAEMAVKLALTGHLVLTVLHAPTPAAALVRLVDIGVPVTLVRDAVAGLVAQRLVRRLCVECREPDDRAHPRLAEWGLAPETRFWRAGGCEQCAETGYRGRTGLFEVLEMNERLGRVLVDGAAAGDVDRAARDEGVRSLLRDGLDKAGRGHTSVAEVLRVTESGR